MPPDDVGYSSVSTQSHVWSTLQGFLFKRVAGMFQIFFYKALFTVVRMWKQPECLWTEKWIKKKWYIDNDGILLGHEKWWNSIIWSNVDAQGTPVVSNVPANVLETQETRVWSLGWKDSPGEGNGYPLPYFGLENSMGCIVHRVAKRQTQLVNSHFIYKMDKQQGPTI